MDFLKYQAFIRIVELGSLTGTARELGYSQPGISRMLAALETEVGFPLLIRKKGKVYPTKDALQLLPHMRKMVGGEHQLRECVKKVASLDEGTLRIGCLPGILNAWIPKALRIFLSVHPNIKIDIYEDTQPELFQSLAEHRIDFALTCSPFPEKYEFYPLRTDHMCVLLPTDHPLSLRSRIAPEQLLDEVFLMPDTEVDEAVWSVFSDSQKPTSRIRIHTRGGRIPLVNEGLGISIAPCIEAENLPEGVASVALDCEYYRVIGVAVQAIEFAPPAAKEFIHILENGVF